MMNQAKRFLRELSLIERDCRGYADSLLLCGFMDRVRRAAVEEDFPFGIDSYDPSVQFKFEDGSVLHIGNPAQVSYPVSAYEKKELKACQRT